jgi:hypothetical protein
VREAGSSGPLRAAGSGGGHGLVGVGDPGLQRRAQVLDEARWFVPDAQHVHALGEGGEPRVERVRQPELPQCLRRVVLAGLPVGTMPASRISAMASESSRCR